jgi:hypothetical protein
MHKQFGRLVLNDKGVARYVSSSLWTSITDEVCRPDPPGCATLTKTVG